MEHQKRKLYKNEWDRGSKIIMLKILVASCDPGSATVIIVLWHISVIV